MGALEDASRRVVAALEGALSAHAANDLAELSRLYNQVDKAENMGASPEYDELAIALNFLDGWVDTAGHDWQHHEGFSRDDWPTYARIIVEALKTGRRIPTPKIRERFRVAQSARDPSLLAKMRRLFGGR